ncbi:MAG TPA: TIGR03564 family F420-dependent LLM class oxidoreductase [Candidatus Dormibacteraeota bacterium]|nr:TIGR03564 family F420-dependent LLM class oxidoreductase [Candidatus Dormibacteraeota bacterium]
MQRLAAFSPAVRTLDESIARAKLAERLGYESVWTSQLPDARDASLVLAAYALNTERIGLGTAVLPIYTRHPTAMAQMAATLDELSHGRFTLGLGISHKVTVEGMWGLKLEEPVNAMREYLEIVRTSLREGSAGFEGRYFSARWGYSGPRRAEIPVMISALHPRMLELAGELADGVVLYMCSPRYIGEHIIPAVKRGRDRAGKSMEGFEIVAGIDSCLTSDREAALDAYRVTVDRYANLPYYRTMMDASGFKEQLESGRVSAAMIDELAAIGDEEQIRSALRRFRDAGVTLVGVGAFSRHKAAAGFEATLEAAAAG